MNLDKLILKDFLTYKDLEYEFEKRPLLVQGLNLTDDKQKTNGTGKSGMQTGIEFCITASNSRDVRDAELVTYDKKEANAQLFASCDVRKQYLHIDWIIKVKGSNKLVLKTRQYGSDEWIDVKFSNVNDGKKFIIEWFAISKEDLFNYYIINKTRFKSFFKSSNREKVDLINRFSDASIIEGLEKIDKDDLDKELLESQRQISSTEGKIELTKENIEKEEERDFEDKFLEDKEDLLEEIEDVEGSILRVASGIASIGDKIDKIKDVKIKATKEDIKTAKLDRVDIKKDIEKATKAVNKAQEDVDKAQKLVDEFESTDWDEEREEFEDQIEGLEEVLENLDLDAAKFELQETKIKKFIQKIEIILGGIITCPSCTHEFLLDENVDLDEERTKKRKILRLGESIRLSKGKTVASISIAKDKIKTVEGDVSAINKKEELENKAKNLLIKAVNEVDKNLTAARRKLSNHEQELKVLKADMDDYDKEIVNHNTKITNHKVEIENLKEKIVNYNTEIDGYKSQISALKVGDNKDLINTLKKDLKGLERSIASQREENQKIGDKIYNTNQWINNFKQFRTFLANQSLEVIEYHCNRYLIDMGSDLRVKMEGFKMLSNGSMKEEITAKVVRDRERTFSSFSGGEQGRLLFSSILANRHMINETNKWGGLDFLSIDEVFEGVDTIGLKHLIESAKTLNIPAMIITHAYEDGETADCITIIKENGVSRVKE